MPPGSDSRDTPAHARMLAHATWRLCWLQDSCSQIEPSQQIRCHAEYSTATALGIVIVRHYSGPWRGKYSSSRDERDPLLPASTYPEPLLQHLWSRQPRTTLLSA